MKFHAYVLCAIEPKYTQEAYRRLTDTQGIKHCHMTSGSWDAILYVEADDPQTLSKTVISKVRSIEGVRRTETLFAFDNV